MIIQSYVPELFRQERKMVIVMVVVWFFFIHFLNKCRIYLVLYMNGNMSPLSFMCSCAVKKQKGSRCCFP